ncbi:class I SAM-dependent RNA methyltransferase [Pseudooceanicola sediminis]|uniref:Class I SAM-dependent RNA methyltransferase n=1 Tax=Pseudooceanicola sediminis TaxID=2211117 RepID=A0A399J6J6_9RHOB|nr:class I SAM-dependent RNA methyltransferase [Pseudooceanicola sediminis]KAA2317259.1 class I SAM-dependent RNA methyltransferase [Puniceibacterium sp. HSS470]RII39612.1 class I SAM-dependent RNA methyltransferase [Pseudooceanicola sediminis]|tara:strand:+ start:10195 stop:11313 length:1119 start_codon:yes stop_codon:yes gene_type:complete
MTAPFEIFLSAPPGLEETLCAEAVDNGFAHARVVPGGVTFKGHWTTVWRANLVMRGAGRVLARIGGFPAYHLAELDKKARAFPWGDTLRPDVALRVEVTASKRSRIYHAGAAQQRIETALRESFGATIDRTAPLVLKTRIENDHVTFSIDTSGDSLHKRGHKPAVGKAPMRETLAALFLRQCGYDGTQSVVDPMCGSGTFVLEAAEIAAGLMPGRSRHFAFQDLASFNADRWADMKAACPPPRPDLPRFQGSDRDPGAIRMSRGNADAAGIGAAIDFQNVSVADVHPPEGARPGLVIVNPPYGERIGNRKLLFSVHASLGSVLKQRFSGWRVGIITSDAQLAQATGLPFLPLGAPVPHGGLRVRLYQTAPLP